MPLLSDSTTAPSYDTTAYDDAPTDNAKANVSNPADNILIFIIVYTPIYIYLDTPSMLYAYGNVNVKMPKSGLLWTDVNSGLSISHLSLSG